MNRIKQEIPEAMTVKWQKIMNNAVESSISAIAIADLEGSLTYVNNSFLKMWGYDDDKEVLGRPGLEFWKTKKKALKILELLRERDTWVGEMSAQRKDGSTFDAHLLMSMVTDEFRKPICVVGSFVDVTERRRAEEMLRETEKRYRKFLEILTDGCFVIGRDWRYIFVNDATCQLLKLTRGELLGNKITELFPGIEDTHLFYAYKNTMDTGKTNTIEAYFPRPDGTPVYCKMHVSAVPEGIVVTAKDITERKKKEAALLKAQNSRLVSIEQLADGVAHNINNILMALYSEIQLQLLFGKSKDKELLDSLGIMNKLSKRIAVIVTDLVTFSRETSTKTGELSNINSLIEKTVLLIKRRVELTNIKIVKNFDESLPDIIVDKGQIERAFTNIFMNSLDVMSNGGKLTISTKLSSTKDAIEITFVDTGSGIAKEHLPKVFDPFFTIKPPGKGTGLGLSISHRIIENHGGSIWIDSELDRGTKVLISLPIKGEKEI